MKRFLLPKYRYLFALIGVLLFINIYVQNNSDKFAICFSFPNNLIFQALSFLIMLFLVLFYCDSIAYIIKMKNYIQIRIGSFNLYKYFLLRILLILCYLIIIFFVLSFVLFGKIYYSEVLALNIYSATIVSILLVMFPKVRLSNIVVISFICLIIIRIF